MPPILIAFLVVAALFAVFWTTRGKPRRWFSRIVAFVVLHILAGVLAGDAQVAAKVGELSVYLGVPAVLIYFVARGRA